MNVDKGLIKHWKMLLENDGDWEQDDAMARDSAGANFWKSIDQIANIIKTMDLNELRTFILSLHRTLTKDNVKRMVEDFEFFQKEGVPSRQGDDKFNKEELEREKKSLEIYKRIAWMFDNHQQDLDRFWKDGEEKIPYDKEVYQ